MKKTLIFSILIATMLTSCQNLFNRHLIDSKAQRDEVTTKFNERIKLIQEHDSDINQIINSELSIKEREGFEFLYVYMPLSDVAMHNSNYVLKQVKSSLEAKSFFKWGKKIPADIFLHFVLPYRINNEYTDSARQVFLAELKGRLEGLSMYDAALEVNHWCHEKVIYKSTDERTSGPLTTVRTAFGRCGEESTFTVAALRSVGIPARQVYTPRWAHTDDNHAWVEVWVDGKWYFLGACEPEPELNMGWFAGPAKRAMMMRTFVFGKYNGNEEKLTTSEWFTEINLLGNYAPTKNLNIKVVDENGNVVNDAKVEFQLYNYAEFYPIGTKQTNEEGSCVLTTGFGDLIVWASKENKIGFSKADKDATDITINISENQNFADQNLTLTPPAEQTLAQADQSKADANNARLKDENAIRNKYIATFIDSASATNLAMEKGVNIDETWKYLKLSRGNWQEIYNFIKGLDGKDLTVGMAILNSISEKDLHDITAIILQDHIATVDSFPSIIDSKDFKDFDKYVLSPRIGREFITPWRSFLQNSFTFDEIGFFRNNPYNIAKWIKENITLDKESNYYRVPLSPESVFKLRIADEYSRNVFFVAACRSFGIPARLEPSTKRPQFLMRDKWNDVVFEETSEQVFPKGTLNLNLGNNLPIQKPQYYTHFTIGKLEKGKFVSLDFETDPNVNNLPAKINLDAGFYRLITGNRLSNGTVLCKFKYFEIKENQTTTINLEFNENNTQSQIFGMVNTETSIPNLNGENSGTIGELVKEKSAVVAIVEPNKEPTKHLMVDIAAVKTDFDNWGGNVVFVVGKDKMTEDFNPSNLGNLPTSSKFGYDKEQTIANAIATGCNKTLSTNYPIVTVINANGEVIFYSEGYSIGLGEQVLKALK
ncbi:MAG: transglutaminase domain-containing protein [Bacteroidales bacterium]